MASAVGAPEIIPPPQQFAALSGFWRRLAAFLVDSLILGTVGFALGLALFDTFARLGPWGRLVGFAIALPYFGVLNSSVCEGQTLGKRALSIRVVDRSGATIGLGRCSLRAMIFLVPYFLNNLQSRTIQQYAIAGTVAALIIFGAGGAIIYLAIFNRATRQSLHDLLLGTYVVRTTPSGPVSTPAFWKKHWTIILALNVAVVAGSWVASSYLSKVPSFAGMLTLQRTVDDTGRFQAVSVMKGTNWGPQGTNTFLNVNVVSKSGANLEDQTVEVARIVLEKEPTALGSDTLNITVTYGFDIGIASGWRSYFNRGSPEAWTKRFQQGSPPQ